MQPLTLTTHQAALDTIADMRELVIRRRADQDANAELANETITMLREKREKVVKEDAA